MTVVLVKVSIDGQITIPQELRDQVGLLPGTEVEFLVDEHGLLLRPTEGGRATRPSFDEWLEKASGSAVGYLTTDQWMKVTRGGC